MERKDVVVDGRVGGASNINKACHGLAKDLAAGGNAGSTAAVCSRCRVTHCTTPNSATSAVAASRPCTIGSATGNHALI